MKSPIDRICWIALGIPDRRAPGPQRLDELVELRSQRVDHRPHLLVGDVLDRFTRLPSSVREGAVAQQAAGDEAILGRVELLVAPAACARIRPQRQAPVGLGEETDLGRVEAGDRPRRNMGVAAVLAQPIGVAPRVAERRPGKAQSPKTGVERLSLGSKDGGGPAQELAGALDSIGTVAEGARQLRDGAVIAGRADRGRVGLGPAFRDGGNDDGRVEHSESRRDHLAGNLTHHRTTRGEVRGPVGGGDAGEVARARVEPELLVVGVALGREVDLAGERLDHAAEGARLLRQFIHR